MNPLQRLVDSRMEELKLSTRDVADRSRGLISHGTVATIRKGEHPPRGHGEQVLEGLAHGLRLPLSLIESAEAARVALLVPNRWPRPQRRRPMTESGRQAVRDFLEGLLEKA